MNNSVKSEPYDQLCHPVGNPMSGIIIGKPLCYFCLHWRGPNHCKKAYEAPKSTLSLFLVICDHASERNKTFWCLFLSHASNQCLWSASDYAVCFLFQISCICTNFVRVGSTRLLFVLKFVSIIVLVWNLLLFALFCRSRFFLLAALIDKGGNGSAHLCSSLSR